MSTGESFESRFEKIDMTLKDPKSEVNVDCLLVSRERQWAAGPVSPNFLPCGTESRTPGWVTTLLSSALVFCLLSVELRVRECLLCRERGFHAKEAPAQSCLRLVISLASCTFLFFTGCHKGRLTLCTKVLFRNAGPACERETVDSSDIPILSSTTFFFLFKSEVLICCG